MINVLVTGAKGFIGKNLCIALKRLKNINVIEYDIDDNKKINNLLEDYDYNIDYIFHLAGINRPKDEKEFKEGNVNFTKDLLNSLSNIKKNISIIFSSSIQAELNNPYGNSKKEAEELLINFARETGNFVFIYRLPNVFGKWCKPNYNSVIATFCYNLTHKKDIQIDDPEKIINFIYIDDVIKNFLKHINKKNHFNNNLKNKFFIIYPKPIYPVKLKNIEKLLKNFIKVREDSILPNLNNKFEKYLYSTFLSYYESKDLEYKTIKKEDNRGYLFEFIKSKYIGQIFISRTYPGITRGNHYHDTKVEKFCVVEGKAKISFRNVITNEKFDFIVEGKDCKIIDIPPGVSHNITNIGDTDLITIFWANEIFDELNPDTYFMEV